MTAPVVVRGARLALGLLTVSPAGRVETDRRTVRAALLLAPAVGLVLGALAWAAGAVVLARGGGPLVAAVASVATLAVATRGLHLDGLADVADGLGSARPAEAALEIMRKSDVGPFGVATLVLVLLLQVGVVAQAWEVDLAAPMLLLACLTGRLALLWACRSSVPAARPDGLGSLVAGAVPTLWALLLTGAACLGVGIWSLHSDALAAANSVVSVLAGLAAATLLLRRALSRLGGMTGDVLGALVETATTAAALTFLLLS